MAEVNASITKQWKIRYQPVDDEYFEFTFNSDGTGTCHDLAYETRTEFEWDTTLLPHDIGDEEEAKGILQDTAADLFWSDINPQLGEEQIISWDDPNMSSDSSPSFSCGSYEELESLATLILFSFPEIWLDGAEERSVRFNATSEHMDTSAGVDEDHPDFELGKDLSHGDRARVLELLEFVVAQNTPVGDYLEYNDGARDRMSGYSWYAKDVTIFAPRPSFHEIAEARTALREKLKSSLATADLDRLLPLDESENAHGQCPISQ